MTDGDDDTAEEETSLDADTLESRVDDAATGLEEAETESDLDEVATILDDVEDDIDAADLPEPEDEDGESRAEQLEGRLTELREQLEAERGPYAADVVDVIEEAQPTLRDTRWTEDGRDHITTAIAEFRESVAGILDIEFEDLSEAADPETLAGELDSVAEAVSAAELDPDENAEPIGELIEAGDALSAKIEDAEEWDDLETNEKLLAQGFYDVLGHYKDFPIEWSALKEHEEQGNADMVLLALDSLGSEFMERHCLEALERMGPQEAFEPMHDRAQKRDRPAIRILGKIGDEAAVETLLEYVGEDSDPQLQKVSMRALGEIGSEEATQAIANKLEMENDHVRPFAARALGLIGDTRAIEPLADTLDTDENDNVRAAAAWALRQIGTENALQAAAEHTDARSYLVQHEAETAADALDAAAVEA
jgi:hypothetical protein